MLLHVIPDRYNLFFCQPSCFSLQNDFLQNIRRLFPFRTAHGQFLCNDLCLHVLQIGSFHKFLSTDFGIVHFLIKSIPVRDLSPIRETHHKNGEPRLPEKHLFQILFFWKDISLLRHFSAVLPEFIPINEEVLVLRFFPFCNDILELP